MNSSFHGIQQTYYKVFLVTTEVTTMHVARRQHFVLQGTVSVTQSSPPAPLLVSHSLNLSLSRETNPGLLSGCLVAVPFHVP
jgi:hypothetical protein